jgi:hypothetical protein
LLGCRGWGLAVRVAGPFCAGDQPWRPGAGEEGSQPYLGARGAGRRPGDKMMDRVSPPAGMRPLSLIGPSAVALRGKAGGGWQAACGSWPR